MAELRDRLLRVSARHHFALTAQAVAAIGFDELVDLLPDELVGPICEKMDIGIEAIRKAWESQAAVVR
jgi:hypothetical protein